MKNRYGDEYHFEQLDHNTYTIVGALSHWRYGGREGQEQMDFTDLGFVDPAGGPFIGLGYIIQDRPVRHISVQDNMIIFTVE